MVAHVASGFSLLGALFVTLLCVLLGINPLRHCLPSVNARLSDALKLLHPTGHSGRKTFVSVAINEKVPPEIVAVGSMHNLGIAQNLD